MPASRMPSSSTRASPITARRADAAIAPEDSTFTEISGPMPVASPSIRPISGRSLICVVYLVTLAAGSASDVALAAPTIMTNDTRATAAVIDFVTQWNLDRFPREAISLAKQCIVDGLGVILAGSTAHGTAIVRDYVRAGGEVGEATVLGAETFSCRAASAALVNGTAGHALDFDDTQLSSSPDKTFGLLTHPTIPPLAASLAIGERL